MSEVLDNETTFTTPQQELSQLAYPLNLKFKIGTLANDFVIADTNQKTFAYVRQKMFKFIDEIQVFTNESKSELQYTIKANKWIDFSASYVFSDKDGVKVGRVARKGMASLWKARYEVFDADDNYMFLIQEDNGWTKVFDAILGEIPILGLLTGYLFNPAYSLKREDGTVVLKLKKEPSMFGRHFSVSKASEIGGKEEKTAILSLKMMILMERRRG